MTEIDAVFRDLEAGLFLQTRTKQGHRKSASADADWHAGVLTITFQGRQISPIQALIGRDFVAWADAQGLVIVPGSHASIRVEKSRIVRVESGPSFVAQHKLKLAKYLRRLAGQNLQLEMHSSSSNLAGSLLDVRGEFALIDSGAATAFAQLSRIRRIRLPVNNFSENVDQGFRYRDEPGVMHDESAH
jgi:hypothetical protein